MEKPTNTTAKKPARRGGKKVSAGAVKKAKTHTRKHQAKKASLWLAIGEPSKQESPEDGGEIVLEINSVE